MKEKKEMNKDVQNMPDARVVYKKTTESALKIINKSNDEEKVKIQRKHEAIRDIALGVVKSLQDMWEELELDTADERTMRKYAGWFVKPCKDILDIARKSNVDLHEMKFGKKITVDGQTEKFEDFIMRMKQQIDARPQNKIIDVVDVKEIKDENNGDVR